MLWINIFIWTVLDRLRNYIPIIGVIVVIFICCGSIVDRVHDCTVKVISHSVDIDGNIADTITTEMQYNTTKVIVSGIKKAAIVVVIFILLYVFIPTSKDYSIIIVAPAIVKSKLIKEDIPEIYKAAVAALKERFINAKEV